MVVSSPASIASRGSLQLRTKGAEVLAAACNVDGGRRTDTLPKVPDVTLQPEQGGAHIVTAGRPGDAL